MTEAQTKKAQELLAFRLDNQEYALDIAAVREIRGWTRPTPMPLAPSFMRGVINLRGTVLPIMDLRERLGLPKFDRDDRNVIAVVQNQGSTIGLLVDAVSDIVAVDVDNMQDLPGAILQNGLNAIKSITVLEDRMIRILDLPEIVSLSESNGA